jgi:hypothetical protein
MRPFVFGLLVLLLVPMAGLAQFPPDLGPVGEVIDEVAGTVVPPVLNATYTATGQNMTREDVQLFLAVNFTKAAAAPMGLLIGSSNIEVQADVQIRVELRVISSDRIRAAIEGENAYNMSAENATWLSQVYIPAEVFRASASAQVVAMFKEDMEASLSEWLAEAVPELDVLALKIGFENVSPLQSFTDLSLTEPPIVVTLDATIQYLRVESARSLLDAYLGSRTEESDAKKEYVRELKAEHGDPLRTRDFFAAAAYTQLLNLSMQPGWSLDVEMNVPRGYSFEYTNEEVVSRGERNIAFSVDALEADDEEQAVILASITHRRAVALGLFVAMWGAALLVGLPARFLYGRYRIPKMTQPT